ncbi:hypothetical protein GCM10017635_05570 [Paracoccus kondratievae]|uniref:Type VI secretion system tip protein VgrG n=1 Tax=Paracoccus kondratievae TaxID=135740 RepID=A0AAD3RRZ3_9RHOB|nr:hypothetical protein GCM10017635_05570 [Paracoccus kondratievae]
MGENGHRYDLVLRPWFWLAGRRRNQRIFHNRTVVQILRELLSDYAQLGDPALDVQLSQGYAFTGSYVLMPDTAPMAPPRRTHVPVVHGPQTAMVVGEGEIDCDEYGRILVRFHWDLDAAHSMRCRVSQNWAGAGWGGMVIPRIGMEVVVEFLEGDPDKPIVTGCVYNGKNKVPYELPASKTISTFKSNTHQGSGYNELRFEDEKGREEIFLHAERDRNEKTKHNHTERIDRNWVQSVGRHKLVEVDGNHGESVHGNMSIHVGSSGGGRVLTPLQRIDDQGIGSVAYELPTLGINDVGRGIFSLFADTVITETTPGIKTQFIGINKTTTVGVSITQAAGSSVDITSGSRISMDSGDATNISAGKELRILIGQSTLYMNSEGYIRLTGDTLHLDFKNGIEMAGGDQIVAKAKKINLN